MNWSPRAVIALLLGVVVLIFVLFSGAHKLLHPAESSVAFVVEAWKELLVTIVGGLLVWIGGKPKQ